jgi:hypothetical protein
LTPALYLRAAKSAKVKKGDERTGPALNPLKGSSARVPHAFGGANRTPSLNPYISSYCWLNPRKNVPPPAKIYPQAGASTAFTVSSEKFNFLAFAPIVDPGNSPLLS